MEMILIQREVTGIKIDGNDVEVLKQLCKIVHFYMNDSTLSVYWNKPDAGDAEIKKFINFVLDRKE